MDNIIKALINNEEEYRKRMNDKDTVLKFSSRQKIVKYYFLKHNRDKDYCLGRIEKYIDDIRNNDYDSNKLKEISSNIIIYTYAYASLSEAGYIDETIFSIIDKKFENLEKDENMNSSIRLFKQSHDFNPSDIALGETYDLREDIDLTNSKIVDYIQHSNNKEVQKSLKYRITNLINSCEEMLNKLKEKLNTEE